MITDNTKISDLTVGEFRDLFIGMQAERQGTSSPLAYGLQGLAGLLGVSISTAKRIRATGVLDDAIMQMGRTIVIDSELAIKLFRKSTK